MLDLLHQLSSSRAILLAFWLWMLFPGVALPHHNGAWLPLVPNTPLMQSIIQNGSYTWCVNDTAGAYPNFLGQLRDVNDQYTARVGIRNSQVAWGTVAQTGCMIQHNAVPGLQCGGCAAHVFYANWPVVVEYKIDLAYFDWRSAQGHESGHAILGLHEQYDDVSFTCLDRPWTVMSCGFSQVKYPQAFDITNGCAVLDPNHLQFVGCGLQPPPCGDPCWSDGPGGFRWRFSDGRSYAPNSGCGEWYSARNTLEWSICAYNWDADPDLDGRYQEVIDEWVTVGGTGSFLHDETGEWFGLTPP